MRRIGIVGAGGMGNWHALRWRALPVELAGFYDADSQRAVALAAKHGGQAFVSLEQLLSQYRPSHTWRQVRTVSCCGYSVRVDHSRPSLVELSASVQGGQTIP